MIPKITTFQSRLGTVHDNIRRKAINNSLRLISIPTEVLRFKNTKNQEGDVITRVIEEASLIHVVFQKIENVPIRLLEKNGEKFVLTSLINAFADENAKQQYLVTAVEQLTIGDILCRVFLPTSVNNKPTVLLLEVVEVLGTIGTHSLITCNYQTTLLTQDLNQEMIDVIADFAVRRKRINY
jgi:hypothetical protein